MHIYEPIPSHEVTYLQEVSTGMAIASGWIIEGRDTAALETEVKTADQSLLTKFDRQSETMAKGIWQGGTQYPILGEETGVSGEEAGARILGMNDPIDGTRPFVIGAHTSTTMAGAYDLARREFIASSVVHPTSHTLVEASAGKTIVSDYAFTPYGYEIQRSRQSEAWEGPLSGSTVLVDNFAPFNRGEQMIMDRSRLGRFMAGLLEVEAVPQGYGSNGYHQLLLAQGGEKLAGAVMLAQGGPWDAIGLPAVLHAGGSARAFKVEDGGRLSEQEPQDPFTWDILVLGSTALNADTLAGVVERSFQK